VEFTEPFFLKFGIQVAKALVTCIDGLIPVCLLNTQSSEVKIPKGVTVASFIASPLMEVVTLVEDPLDLTK
jgi:hypothetical protein